MAHVIFIPDTSEKACAVYLAEEIGNNTRVLKLKQCMADKVPIDLAPDLGAALRDIQESKERLARIAAEQARTPTEPAVAEREPRPTALANTVWPDHRWARNPMTSDKRMSDETPGEAERICLCERLAASASEPDQPESLRNMLREAEACITLLADDLAAARRVEDGEFGEVTRSIDACVRDVQSDSFMCETLERSKDLLTRLERERDEARAEIETIDRVSHQSADEAIKLTAELAAAEAALAQAREALELNRVELGEVEDLRDEIARLQGTLRYLEAQARNGTLHPQVVIQNCLTTLSTLTKAKP